MQRILFRSSSLSVCAIWFVILFLNLISCSAQNKSTVDISVSEFEAKLKNEPGILVDVRTPNEFASGYIAGALHINLFDDDFNERILKLDSSKTIYLYCASGGRSGEAAELLLKSGYKNVYNLKEGIIGWKEKKLPIKK